MDFEYVRQYGYASWQVIPLCFVTYIGMVLVFGGSGELAWHSYLEKYHAEGHQPQKHYMTSFSWTVVIAGACLLFVSILLSIVVCLIVPVMRKRRQRARQPVGLHVHVPEPESGSAEGEIKTWFASSASDVQEPQESLHTLQQRYNILCCKTKHVRSNCCLGLNLPMPIQTNRERNKRLSYSRRTE